MFKLRVTAEGLPQRCEICHQTDCYDAARNHCSRCVGLKRQLTETAPAVDPIEAVLPATKLLGQIAIVLIVTAVTTSWGLCIGIACGALVNTQQLPFTTMLLGGTIGCVWGIRIGCKAVAGKYRPFYQIHT